MNKTQVYKIEQQKLHLLSYAAGALIQSTFDPQTRWKHSQN